MTEDALGDDKLLTIVQLLPGAEASRETALRPSIAQVACLGQIIEHERLPDGRFRLLLLGRKRVVLNREIPTGKLYRIAEAEILEDVTTAPEEPARSALTDRFRRLFERHDQLDSDLLALLEGRVPLGVLTDIIAHALAMSVERKQWLLAEPVVERRVEAILDELDRNLANDADDASPFPPPFSDN